MGRVPHKSDSIISVDVRHDVFYFFNFVIRTCPTGLMTVPLYPFATFVCLPAALLGVFSEGVSRAVSPPVTLSPPNRSHSPFFANSSSHRIMITSTTRLKRSEHFGKFRRSVGSKSLSSSPSRFRNPHHGLSQHLQLLVRFLYCLNKHLFSVVLFFRILLSLPAYVPTSRPRSPYPRRLSAGDLLPETPFSAEGSGGDPLLPFTS